MSMGTETAIKERPILFSGPMVRAILEGRKTQTRRVLDSKNFRIDRVDGINGPYDRYREFNYRKGEGLYESGSGPFDPSSESSQQHATSFCRYGQPGERLWVRETHAIVPRLSGCEHVGADSYFGVRYKATWTKSHALRWTPSIHMLRWASRINLEITDVRVERLCEISDTDIKAEGIEPDRATDHPRGVWYTAFRELWDSINGKNAFDANPWVWAITFKRATT
jgi:hypothetical protein